MYWLILLRPYSPSRLSAWSDGTTPVISCMMIDALMYGFMPDGHDREVATGRRPRTGRAGRPAALPSTKSSSWALSMPGTGTAASSRKTISRPRTYRTRRRMSGARKALRRESNTGQASSPDGVSASSAARLTRRRLGRRRPRRLGCRRRRLGARAPSAPSASARRPWPRPWPSAFGGDRRRLSASRAARALASLAQPRPGRRPFAARVPSWPRRRRRPSAASGVGRDLEHVDAAAGRLDLGSGPTR